MREEAKDKKDITIREKEILILVSEGLTTSQISQKLFISRLTVKSHRQNLLKKLNAANSVELVYLATINGLI